jgi:hypothetical protein
MTDLAPDLAGLPVRATFDGELVAFGPDGSPDFPLLCERMLMRRPGIAVTYMIFDLLSLDGRSLLNEPYVKRRAELEALDLNDVRWQTPETFDDGGALFEAVCAHELEGAVANAVQAGIGRVSAAGSRPRAGSTGGTRWSGRAPSTRSALGSSSDPARRACLRNAGREACES